MTMPKHDADDSRDERRGPPDSGLEGQPIGHDAAIRKSPDRPLVAPASLEPAHRFLDEPFTRANLDETQVMPIDGNESECQNPAPEKKLARRSICDRLCFCFGGVRHSDERHEFRVDAGHDRDGRPDLGHGRAQPRFDVKARHSYPPTPLRPLRRWSHPSWLARRGERYRPRPVATSACGGATPTPNRVAHWKRIGIGYRGLALAVRLC